MCVDRVDERRRCCHVAADRSHSNTWGGAERARHIPACTAAASQNQRGDTRERARAPSM